MKHGELKKCPVCDMRVVGHDHEVNCQNMRFVFCSNQFNIRLLA